MTKNFPLGICIGQIISLKKQTKVKCITLAIDLLFELSIKKNYLSHVVIPYHKFFGHFNGL